MTDQLSNQPAGIEPNIYPLMQQPVLTQQETQQIEELGVATEQPQTEVADFDYSYGRDLGGSFVDKVKNTIGAVGDTLKTLKNELWTDREQRAKRLGAFALGVGSQVADRGRLMVFVLPEVFNHTLTYTMEHNYNTAATATASGVAVGGLFGIWTYAVGKTFQVAANAFPETAKAVEYNQPAMVDSVKRATGGFPKRHELVQAEPEKPEAGYDVSPYQTRKSAIGKAALALSRGLKTAFLYGTTAQVGIAKVYEHSQESNEKRLKVTGAEAAVALGGIAALVGGLVVTGSVETAQHIKDVITDKSLLLKISLGLIGGSWGLGWLARHKEAKLRNQAHEVPELAVETA